MVNPKNRIAQLRAEIEKHNRLYYDKGEPEISDFEYDQLLKELVQLEKENPELAAKESPAVNVGEKTSSLFPKVKHEIPMLSIQDYFSYDELKEFLKPLREKYPNIDFVVEPKIDGLSSSITYENGKYVLGKTRGNGYEGDVITENLAAVQNIPNELKFDDIPLIEVRGEVYMRHEDLEAINNSQKRKGSNMFKNPRNCAAGTLKSKDPNVIKERKLYFKAFNIQRIEGFSFDNHVASLNMASLYGIPVIEKPIICKTDEEIFKAIESIQSNRNNYDFDIDGAVIKVNSLSIREELGNTQKCPRWAAAYKYPPEEKTTTLRDVLIQVSRTGCLSPVAVFDTVELAGTSVSKATLHNQAQIDRLNINIGDQFIIRKAGEIIPEIAKVVEKHSEGSYQIPMICPICGSHAEMEGTEVHCQNSLCPAKLSGSVEFFASRGCMDIGGLGTKNAIKLCDGGYIKKLTDIYRLDSYKDELIESGIIGKEKSVEKLLYNIERSKKGRPLSKFIKALGNKGIGGSIGEILAKTYKNLEGISNAKIDELSQLDGIGEVSAKQIYDFFHDENNRALLKEFSELGVTYTVQAETGKSLKGLNFVITGTFDMKRDQIKKMIKDNGGNVSESISRKTDYLIAGENAGSKMLKAVALGIKILTLEDLTYHSKKSPTSKVGG